LSPVLAGDKFGRERKERDAIGGSLSTNQTEKKRHLGLKYSTEGRILIFPQKKKKISEIYFFSPSISIETWTEQGTLAEGEGYVRLTSLYLQHTFNLR
jgi:hypothetical protein